MAHLIAFLTWRCGLGCPYCGYYLQPDGMSLKYCPFQDKHTYVVEREITGDEWIKQLKHFAKLQYTIEFCGGEVTKHHDFVKIANSLPQWAITSNTMNLPEGLDYSKCFSWTASLHYHIGDKGIQKFMNNVDIIASKVSSYSMTMVAMPNTIARVKALSEMLTSKGIKNQQHVFYDDPSFSWYHHPKELKELETLPNVCYEKRLFSWGQVKGSSMCRGGSGYITIGPDGKMFMCLTAMLEGWGEIPAPDINFYDCKRPCHLPCDWSWRDWLWGSGA